MIAWYIRSRVDVVVLVALWLLFPVLGWAACSEEARNYYQKGVQAKDKYITSRHHCPEECLEEQRYFYQRAAELCPSDPQAHINLGDVFEKLGRYREARTQYTTVLSLCTKAGELCSRPVDLSDKTSPSLLAITYFGLGDLYFHTGEYAKAVDAYQKGLKLHPGDTLAQERQRLALRLKGQAFPDTQTIEETLGGKEMTLMGVGGVRPDPRIHIVIPFSFNDDK